MALSCAGRRYLPIALTTRRQNSIGSSPDRPMLQLFIFYNMPDGSAGNST